MTSPSYEDQNATVLYPGQRGPFFLLIKPFYWTNWPILDFFFKFAKLTVLVCVIRTLIARSLETTPAVLLSFIVLSLLFNFKTDTSPRNFLSSPALTALWAKSFQSERASSLRFLIWNWIYLEFMHEALPDLQTQLRPNGARKINLLSSSRNDKHSSSSWQWWWLSW